MKEAWLSAALIAGCSAIMLVSSQQRESSRDAIDPVQPIQERRDEPIQPLSRPIALDSGRVELGRRLFHDPSISGDGTIACASCHDLTRGGDDGRTRSIGIGGQLGEINAPTVLNAALSFRQFWDGRAASLEDQIDGPLQNPKEMGTTWEQVLATLSGDASYVRAFDEIYPDGISRANVKNAIATFERSLLAADSPFDRFLRGDEQAIGESERRGYALFKSNGCIGCHQGIGIGGNLFQRLGIARDYFADRGDITPADLGRYAVTGREEDRYVFKVPSLRNVALTAPYFHDGSADTLEEAVKVMSRYQLGREIAGNELAAIVSFLESLTADLAEAS